MKLNKLIGQTLGEKIEQKGFNYTTFAKAVGFSQSYISKIVNGSAKRVTVETIEIYVMINL